MSLAGTIAVLRDMALFARVDERRLRAIALMGEPLRLGEGERLAEKGDPGDALFVILEGAVDVRLPGPEGEVSVARLGPGEVVGEMAVFTGRPRSGAIVALGELTVLRLERAAVLSLLREFPDVALEIIRMLALRLEATTARSV